MLIAREQSIGRRIYLLRTEKRMTMEDLAKKVGVQKSAINKYEKGIVKQIPADRLKRIADVLGTSAKYLRKGDSGCDLFDLPMYDAEGNPIEYTEQEVRLSNLHNMLEDADEDRYPLVEMILTADDEKAKALSSVLLR